jgi:hypothetical protein
LFRQKVTKTIARDMTASPTSCRLDSPAVLAEWRAIHRPRLHGLRWRRPWMAGDGATTGAVGGAAAAMPTRGQGAHVRLQGCRSSRRRAIGERQGQSRQQDVVEITATGAMVFGYFLPKQKAARPLCERKLLRCQRQAFEMG